MAVIVILAGLLPGFAWLTFYLTEATHAEPKRLLAFTFSVGIAFGFFTIAIEEAFNHAAAGIGIEEFSIASIVALALIEEVMKFSAAHFAVKKSPAFSAPVDAMIYMIVAAMGFATLENVGAVLNIPAQVAFIPAVFETLSFRFVGATLLHSLTSGIVGYHWALGIVRKNVGRQITIGIVSAAVVHSFFNYLILVYGNTGFVVLFLVVVGFFVLQDFEELKVAPTQQITS